METRRVVRAEQWWDPKVAPLVGVAALAAGALPGPVPAAALGDLALLLVSIVGIAAFGHLLNDLCDLDADAAAGKPNRLRSVAPPVRAASVLLALVAGLAPWWWLPVRPAAWAAVGIEVSLLTIYSVPPIRLKGRAMAGALADAAYAFAVPFAIVVLALGPDPLGGRGTAALVALVAFGLLAGLRGILWHQIGDLEADRSAGVGTAVASMGVDRTERLLATALPVEIAALLVAGALGAPRFFAVVFPVFFLWRTFQVTFLWEEPLVPAVLREPRQRVQVIGFEYVNELIERWVPLGALVVVAWSSPWWWLAVLGCLLAFRNVVRTFFAWDLWALPDAVERLAYARKARRDIRTVAQQRIQRLAAGPDPLTDPTARRWVFVVCGPSSHLETLSTALRHLRPVTQAEIWVVTDAARNARPIDDPAIDRVVDVATPPELDDHQASIWLKTSVHRHVPVGEWCYLDSDIIAVAPGVEEVFDHRAGPVAFASDLTIRENAVDWFSPWAMTCDCRGLGDESTCSHLREQLQIRFGLDVPGDWLHWNGGVFVFGPEAGPVLDLWHERAVTSFGWPEWKTRDQGALIATVWTLGLQDLPRLPPTFNFIADLGNHDLCLDVERGWAHHPSGPWYQARMLHLYTSALEDPTWNLGRDVEAVVLRRSAVRIMRWERSELRARASHLTRTSLGSLRWKVQIAFETAAMKLRKVPHRLTPARIARTVRRRLGQDVSHIPVPGLIEAEPQRAERAP